MPHAYTEDQLVEQPAIELFAALGWETVSAMDEVFGAGGTLGRETTGEVVLVARLRAALERLNPDAAARGDHHRGRRADARPLGDEPGGGQPRGLRPAQGRHPGLGARPRARRTEDRAAAGHRLGEPRAQRLPARQPDDDHRGALHLPARSRRIRQRSAAGGGRAEEAGRAGASRRSTRTSRSYKHPQNGIPQLFWYNALLIASNGTESRVGSLTADWERFFEWKRVEREDEPRRVSLEVMLRGVCDPARLLDLVENFTLFSEQKAGLVKILGAEPSGARRQQRHCRDAGGAQARVTGAAACSGRRRARQELLDGLLRAEDPAQARRATGRSWSSPTASSWTTRSPRPSRPPARCREAESDDCHAGSGAHLRELLRGNHRYVFTLIHKFQTPEMLCDRPDVIVLTDEAHRSQYDTLALNMRAALPKALFLAFTGTPLIAGEERTARGLRRLRLDLRLPAVGRGRRDGAALLREPDAGAAARAIRTSTTTSTR